METWFQRIAISIGWSLLFCILNTLYWLHNKSGMGLLFHAEVVSQHCSYHICCWSEEETIPMSFFCLSDVQGPLYFSNIS